MVKKTGFKTFRQKDQLTGAKESFEKKKQNKRNEEKYIGIKKKNNKIRIRKKKYGVK